MVASGRTVSRSGVGPINKWNCPLVSIHGSVNRTVNVRAGVPWIVSGCRYRPVQCSDPTANAVAPPFCSHRITLVRRPKCVSSLLTLGVPVSIEPVHPDLVKIALDKVEGFQFERFVQDFYSTLVGASFVPLGGMHDGGADGFDGEVVYEEVDAPTAFYQVSVQEDYRTKIRHTVGRLREVGRDPRTLVYVTSRTVSMPDAEERSLSRELDVAVQIRDAKYITAHINDSAGTIAAFNHHIRHLTDFLQTIGASSIITPSAYVQSPAVYVFLEQELARRRGDASLLDAVTDSLILWSLEGTDPDTRLMMSREDVLEKISREIPAVRQVVKGRIGDRLEWLSDKGYPGGRQVRWHKKANQFCLPYETRERIEDENRADEAMRLDVLASFYSRIREDTARHLDDLAARATAELTLRSLQMAFEREGLAFASFLETKDNAEYATMTDAIAAALAQRNVSGREKYLLADAVFATIRRVLYDSVEVERAYLAKLSRTYTLLFTLNSEPRLIEFFQQLAGTLHLYVGADLLVRALSERYLAVDGQLTRNTLLMASRLGARLVLTEPVLEEVLGNLRAADAEFRNWFEPVEYHVDHLMARNAPKIMVRAYFYARLDPRPDLRKPGSWPAFVSQFLPYADLHKASASDHLRRYLLATFGMEFESTDELMAMVDRGAVQKLAEDLADSKPNDRLAFNDALMAMAVYGRRFRWREESRVTEFGYETWWLTTEARILQHTRPLVREHRGAPYIMRADFLLNFMTLAPSVPEARATLGHVFPSLLGIRLSRRMNEDAFHAIMAKVHAAEDWDDARRTAAIASLVDQLKADFNKRYDVQIRARVNECRSQPSVPRPRANGSVKRETYIGS
jgi:hypothetical protein